MVARSLYFVLFSLVAPSMLFAVEKTEIEDAHLLGPIPPHHLPNSNKHSREGSGLFLSGDFLYWEARQEDMDFAYTGEVAGTTPSANVSKGHYFSPDVKFDPGFRFGIGAHIDQRNWNPSFYYTWYHQNFHKNSIDHANNAVTIMRPTVHPNLVDTDSVYYASGSWRLRMNLADLELGRDTVYGKTLAIRYFTGLRGAWLFQDFDVRYQWYADDINYTPMETKIPQKSRSFGMGFRAGANSSWHMSQNWSIFANLGASLLSTRSKALLNSEEYPIGNPKQYIMPGKTEYKRSFIQPMWEMCLGFSYDNWFEDEGYHFNFRLGWDMQYWLRSNEFNRATAPGKSGDLSLQGITLHLHLGF